MLWNTACTRPVSYTHLVPQSIHLLGYGFDENDETMCALLSSRKERTETVYRDLAEAVTASGCPLRIPDVPKSCGNVLQLRDVMAHVRKTFPSVSEETIRLIDSFSKNLTEANITVEDGIAAIHHAGGKAVWAHPYHSYHLFQKQTLQACLLYTSKRLRNKIIAAHGNRHNDIHVVGRRGQEYYRHIGKLPDLPAPVTAVIVRQQDIHQNQVRLKGCKFFQHMFQIVYTDRLISPFLQMPLYGSADHLIILYNQ